MNANQDPKNRPAGDEPRRRQPDRRDRDVVPRDPRDIADDANRDEAAIPLPFRDEEC
jgi:hypothetical protein